MKSIAVIMTIIGLLVIIVLGVELFYNLYLTKLPVNISPTVTSLAPAIGYLAIKKNNRLLLIASAFEVSLVWLLVLLNVISQRSGLIATLVLVILIAITFFIVYSSLPLLSS